MGLIFFGSSIPGRSVSGNFWVDFLIHKAVHFLEYSVLAVLIARSLDTNRRSELGDQDWSEAKDGQFLGVLGFCVFYAITDEIHQTFVPGRMGIWSDVLIDTLSALAGLGVRYKFRHRS